MRGPFLVIAVARELRHRARTTVLSAVGLAAGVAVVAVMAATTAGVGDAQAAALRSLYGIGTDITITAPASAAKQDAGQPGEVPGAGAGSLLAGRGGLLRSSTVAAVSRVRGVAHAAGALTLTDVPQVGGGGMPMPFSVGGVDVDHATLGPLGKGAITAGRGFRPTDSAADVALVDSGRAATDHIGVGSTVTVAGAAFRVVGIVRQPPAGRPAQIYIPLARAQALATAPGKGSVVGWVDTVYVAVRSAAEVGAVQREIARLLPHATVTGAAELAGAVSGSLAGAGRLAGELGRWVTLAALGAACAIAGLLTMGGVTRRVREIGTLKALGWSTRRVVVQIMTESMVAGAVGAPLGIALGRGAVAVVNAVGATLTATAARSDPAAPAVAIHLIARLDPGVALLAAAISVAGALAAGALASGRAAGLRPADAFADVA